MTLTESFRAHTRLSNAVTRAASGAIRHGDEWRALERVIDGLSSISREPCDSMCIFDEHTLGCPNNPYKGAS